MAYNYTQYRDNPMNKCSKLVSNAKPSDFNPMECVNYLKYNANNTQQKTKLLNKKYQKELMKIIPSFDHCKTLYTKYDHCLEQLAHEYILKLEDQFKSHYEIVKNEMEIQNKLINDIWMESQRFLLLTQSGTCVKIYPEIISTPSEKRALSKFYNGLKKINDSNCFIGISLENIRSMLRAKLNRICDQLDMTVESPFILGNYFLQPLSYIRKILNDLYNYFYMQLWKLQCWAQLLDPADSVAIEDYMALIKPNKDYNDNLIEYLDNCSCLRKKEKNHKPI